MKRLMIVSAMVFVFSIPAYAQMGGQHGQMGQGMMTGEGQQMMPMMEKCQQMMKGMTGEGQQMPMMQMCMPMMRQMMGQGMMMQDMMQMMMDMMKMQKRMMKGAAPPEKKEMMTDMDKMMDKMEKMMSEMRGMMMHGMMGSPPSEPKEEQKEAPTKEQGPKADPHKH